MAGLATHRSAEPATLVVRSAFEDREWRPEDAPVSTVRSHRLLPQLPHCPRSSLANRSRCAARPASGVVAPHPGEGTVNAVEVDKRSRAYFKMQSNLYSTRAAIGRAVNFMLRTRPLQVIRCRSPRMCFGVRDAIELALRNAETAPLTILGDLVHNDAVPPSLRSKGNLPPGIRRAKTEPNQ